VLCEWLTRGAMCSAAHRYLGLPRGTSCTEEERLLGRLVEAALAGRLDPASAHGALEALLALSGAEVLLKHAVREDAVGVDWDYCPLGFALEREVVVFAGSLAGRARERGEAYSWLFDGYAVHAFVDAATDAERGEAFRRYGVEAAITCFRRPPWRMKTYVVSCDWPGPAAEAVAGALGIEIFRGGVRAAPGIYVAP